LEKTQQELEISQNQLTRAEDKFKSLVNVIADPVVIIDHKGHILEINDRVVEKTGFSKGELLGKNFLQIDLLTKKSKAIGIKSLAKRMKRRDVKPYEIEAKTKNGETIYLEVKAHKMKYEDKNADLVVFHDITERKMMGERLERYAEQLEEKVKERTKTLRENEEKLRSIFNSSPDAIAVSDLKGKIIECNKATLEFLGLSKKDELIGKNGLMFVTKKDHQKVKKTMKNILQQRGYEIDTAKTGQEAEQKAKSKFYNLALLDIKLPDMEGTQLLAKLHTNTPKMVKIMVTGYPSLENALEALNQGADAYVTKPVKPEKILALIKEKLEEQSQNEKMTENKVTDWIKTRARKLEDAD